MPGIPIIVVRLENAKLFKRSEDCGCSGGSRMPCLALEPLSLDLVYETVSDPATRNDSIYTVLYTPFEEILQIQLHAEYLALYLLLSRIGVNITAIA
jgi:hypothetical protein